MEFAMPVIISPAADARPYTLTEYDRNWFVVRVQRFASLEALAAAARVNSWRHADNRRWTTSWLTGKPVRQVAHNFRNKTLPVDELVAWVDNHHAARRWYSYRPEVEWRSEPVPGIRKQRGGSGRRRWKTQQERRDNALVLKEEGEVAARPCRRGGYLPHSWDWSPYAKGLRGWKGQHKGQKSWDRPARHGKAAQ
jgi:hypothetical protein